MQEWIIAMLVISVLLVLRDMAKVFFRGRSFLKAEQPAEEKNPQKEKVERYAASFRKLADSFYGLPYRKDYLSNGQVDGIIRETCDRCFFPVIQYQLMGNVHNLFFQIPLSQICGFTDNL